MTTPAWANRLINLTGLAFISFVVLSGCTAMTAQNPSGELKPVNATRAENGDRLFLQGFDVVNYWTQNKHAKGVPEHKVTYQDVQFYFASAENKALFEKEPVKYLPQYGGYCANGIAYGIPWGGDGDSWRIEAGKLYIFGGQGSKDGFEVDMTTNTALAEKYWKEEVKGSNSFAQRWKRLILRVPHYKSGAEIAELVAAKKAIPK